MDTVRILLALLTLALVSACDPTPEAPTVTKAPAAETSPAAQTSMETIATGAKLAGANGILFGPDGNLYIASVLGSDITVINPATGEILRKYTAEDGVTGPDDIAFARDGTFYWTSILTGEVAGLTPDGKRVVAALLPPGANPITFSDDGRLFVSLCFLGTNLYELDPAGEKEPRLITDTLGPGCGLNGMDWGPDNRLYGPRWFTGEVVSFDVDSGDMRIEASGFETPAAVKFNSKGELHVLDTGTGEVVRVGNDEKKVVATLSEGLDNFAFDKNDGIFVSSFADGFIKRINADGSQTTLLPGGMAHSGGIAIMGNNAIVADLHAIRAYDLVTGAEAFVQRNIVGVGEMGGAINLSVDGENLILTSWFDGDVRVWNPATRKRLAHYPGLSLPVAAVRYEGDLVVAEHGKQRVVAFSTTGEEKVLASDLPAPTGLVVEQGDLYVSDRKLGQILMIASKGKALPSPYVVAEGLETPEGFVVVENGFVVVEADPGLVVEVDSAGSRNVLGRVPPGSQAASPMLPPSQVFNGIAISGNSLYVPGETTRELYKISRTPD